MKLRRTASRWLRFIISGRVLERFLNLRYDALVAKALASEASSSTTLDRVVTTEPR
jgi:hypothetical protein